MPTRLIGQTIDQYQVLQLLKQGPTATVLLGRQMPIDRFVAIKVYPREFTRQRRFMDRFRQELGAIARLEHINIVPVYGFGEFDSFPYIAMRYFEGGPLHNLIAAEGMFPPGNAAGVVGHIANALDFAHNRGLIHRNVSSDNILLDSTGTAYLTDFGLEVVAEARAGRGEKPMIGNPAYMPPEQAAGDTPSPQMDVYALGVAAFQMLAARLPYQSDDAVTLVHMHATQALPSVMDTNTGLPPAIAGAIEQAMAKDAASRPASPGVFARTLQGAVDSAGLTAVSQFETLAMAADIDTTLAANFDTGATFAAEPATIQEPSGVYSGQYAAPRRSRLPLILGLLAGTAALVALAAFGLSFLGEGVISNGPSARGSVATLPPTAPPTSILPTATETQPPTATQPPTEEAPGEEPVSVELPVEINQFGVPMVLVPEGVFSMGNPDRPDERPVHDVFVNAFYIDKFEVTNREFELCVDDGNCKPHDETTAPGIFGYFGVDFYASFPVIYMSWDDAVDYCSWRDGRLPTEAEWEKAARWDPHTGETYAYPWGNAFPEPRFLNYYQAGLGRPLAINEYEIGVSAVGAYNMAGNVSEWVADWYDADYYDVSPTDNPTGPASGTRRVMRGGSFETTSGGVAPSVRESFAPATTAVDFGFRCALTPQAGE